MAYVKNEKILSPLGPAYIEYICRLDLARLTSPTTQRNFNLETNRLSPNSRYTSRYSCIRFPALDTWVSYPPNRRVNRGSPFAMARPGSGPRHGASEHRAQFATATCEKKRRSCVSTKPRNWSVKRSCTTLRLKRWSAKRNSTSSRPKSSSAKESYGISCTCSRLRIWNARRRCNRNCTCSTPGHQSAKSRSSPRLMSWGLKKTSSS